MFPFDQIEQFNVRPVFRFLRSEWRHNQHMSFLFTVSLLAVFYR